MARAEPRGAAAAAVPTTTATCAVTRSRFSPSCSAAPGASRRPRGRGSGFLTDGAGVAAGPGRTRAPRGRGARDLSRASREGSGRRAALRRVRCTARDWRIEPAPRRRRASARPARPQDRPYKQQGRPGRPPRCSRRQLERVSKARVTPARRTCEWSWRPSRPWSPWSRPRPSSALGGLRAEALREPLDAALGVDQLLLAREERVAHVADFEVQLRLGGARLEGVAAGAAHFDFLILRMNPRLHGGLLRASTKKLSIPDPGQSGGRVSTGARDL